MPVIDKLEQTQKALQQQDSLMKANNGGISSMDPNLFRAPDYFIYLFTVSKQAFTRQMPPLFRSLMIPACGPDQRYRLVTRISHPLPQIEPNPHNMGEQPQVVYWHDAKKVAQDVCNPNNPGLNQDFALRSNINRQTFDGWMQIGSGQNLNEQGIFWSENEEPAEAEIAAAERRRDGYFRYILSAIDQIPDSDPKKKELIMPEHHIALDRFGEERSWHQEMTVKLACPNCGNKIKSGVAFHVNEGILCVLDPQRALKAGAINRAKYEEMLDSAIEMDAPIKRGPGRPPNAAKE